MKCTSCKKREAEPKKKTCSFCLEKAKRRHKKRTDRLREQGLCLRCAQRPVDPGHVSCARCLTEDAEAAIARYRQRRENAICVHCNKAPATTGSMCEACSKKQRAWGKARAERAATNGLCRKCDKPVVPSKSLCEQHLSRTRMKSAARRKRLEHARLCIGCGNIESVPDKKLCADCIDWRRKYEDARKFGDPELRASILRRDQMACQICLETFSDSQLIIHHIDGSGRKKNPNHDSSNLIALCRRCHIVVHNTARCVKNQDLFLQLVTKLMRVPQS